MAEEEDVSTGIPVPEGASDIIDTDYEIGQDNIEAQLGPFGLERLIPFVPAGLHVEATEFLIVD